MRRLLLALAAVPLLVAACGTDDNHDDADVAFAQQMIPHHEQAVVMADLVPGADASPQVQRLASQIRRAQQPEIEQMGDWLDDWGATDSPAAMGAMNGMASKADIERLGQLDGAAFDRRFLTLMIAHHEGAVDMARAEIEDGQSAEAKTLARSIVDTQTAEIDRMKRLLEADRTESGR